MRMRNQTRVIEIEETNFDLNVEVNRAGDIIRAEMVVAHMEDVPVECTESVKASKYYSSIVEDKYLEIDWNDHGDGSFENFIEIIKEGLKPA